MTPYILLAICVAWLVGRMLNAGNRTGFINSTDLSRVWRRL